MVPRTPSPREAGPGPGHDDGLAAIEAARPKLLGIAYRMLGTSADAEDVVADAAERWLRADRASVTEPEAWLVTVVTRRAMDVLRSARHHREQYTGTWIPEPMTDRDLPAVEAERRETLGLGFLMLLERLTPIERAVLVLHDGFGYRHREIGVLLDRTPAACRQALSRARTRISPPARPVARHGDDAVVTSFLTALAAGDVATALAALAPEVVLHSDGGGVVYAATRPVRGPAAIVRLLANLLARAEPVLVQPLMVNGSPALLTAGAKGWALLAFDLADGSIQHLYLVVAPAKLEALAVQFGRPGLPNVWADAARFRHPRRAPSG